MSTTKKVLTIIFSVLIIGALAFVVTWGILNWGKVKQGMSGTELYTKGDIDKAYSDGYDTALKDKAEWEKLIAEYRNTVSVQTETITKLNAEKKDVLTNYESSKKQVETLTANRDNLQAQVDSLTVDKTSNEQKIVELNTQIATAQGKLIALQGDNARNQALIDSLNLQIEQLQAMNEQLQESNDLNITNIAKLNAQIATLNEQIDTLNVSMQQNMSTVNQLNDRIAEQQRTIAYYEEFISKYETENQVMVTFEFAGSVYSVQAVSKGNKVTVATPTSTEYLTFNGWTLNGSPVDLSTYTVTESVKIVADVTYRYTVDFSVDGSVKATQVVERGGYATEPVKPKKTGYTFKYWTLDGETEVQFNQLPIMANTVFIAKFVKLFTVEFVYEDTVLASRRVEGGKTTAPVSVDNTTNKQFNGWMVNGAIVNVADYKITSDTTFTASISYCYEVTFKKDNAVYATQYVAENSKPTLPTAPTKTNHTFMGWSVDGTTVIDISNYAVSNNVTFVAVFRVDKYNVTFVSEGTTLSTQEVTASGRAIAPNNPTKTNHIFLGWSIDGTHTVDVNNYTVTGNVTFTALFRLDSFTVTFKNGNNTLSTQEIINGNYATAPSVSGEGFMGWMVNGSVVNVSTYRITSATTFTAKFGVWTGIFDDSAYLYGNAQTNKITYNIAGLKAGDKINLTACQIVVKDGREEAGGGFNPWDGYTYVGSGGNFMGNDAWTENGQYDDWGNPVSPVPAEVEINSATGWTSTVGNKDWSEYNQITIKVYCATDGVITIEWTSTANFYISEFVFWYVSVLR